MRTCVAVFCRNVAGDVVTGPISSRASAVGDVRTWLGATHPFRRSVVCGCEKGEMTTTHRYGRACGYVLSTIGFPGIRGEGYGFVIFTRQYV